MGIQNIDFLKPELNTNTKPGEVGYVDDEAR